MKLTIKITTDTETNAYDIRVGDWLAWEDATGVSQTEFATRGKLSDMAFLAWNAAKRNQPGHARGPTAVRRHHRGLGFRG